MEYPNTEINYKDYVIKDGKLVGNFEKMYQKIDDPWQQMSLDYIYDSRRVLTRAWCNKLKSKFELWNTVTVVELGCGFGYTTGMLTDDCFNAIGVDVSPTAISKARLCHPESSFVVGDVKDFSVVSNLEPDIIIMADITWYMLDFLDEFVANLKEYSKNKQVYLVHSLAVYDDGVQQYGKDKFTNLDEILKYFDMDYIEYGYIKNNNSQGTFFVASL